MQRTRATYVPEDIEVFVVYELEPCDDSEYSMSDTRVMLIQDMEGQVYSVRNSDLKYHFTPKGDLLKE